MSVISSVPVVIKVKILCAESADPCRIIFSGTLLASSTMGLTLFDLFGEIVTEADLKLFLRFGSILIQNRPCFPVRSSVSAIQRFGLTKKSKNGIFEDFTKGACIIRSFLLLLELNRFEISQNSEVAANNTDFIGGNIGENTGGIGGEIKEEYEGPT